ncbi:hypothetical protein VTN31DRAFT_4909 [Thermomyces dupontii]|uniref:uncharacterized protein n=1 Tax=Talaromyces thermophilus TaxID=28565 RepID=UPI003741F6DF
MRRTPRAVMMYRDYFTPLNVSYSLLSQRPVCYCRFEVEIDYGDHTRIEHLKFFQLLSLENGVNIARQYYRDSEDAPAKPCRCPKAG